MKFYHATKLENVQGILTEGLVSKCEGVFLCEKPFDAAKFLLVRNIQEMLIVEVNIRKNSKKLVESFDHSYEFFKCRAFVYTDNIPIESITNYSIYKF